MLINSKEDTVLKFYINLNVAFHVVERNTCKFDENFAAKAVLGLRNFFFKHIPTQLSGRVCFNSAWSIQVYNYEIF